MTFSPCVVLGGTGMLATTVEQLARSGEHVVVTARRPELAPAAWASLDVEVVAVDRDDEAGLDTLLAPGVRLLVDGQCYTPVHARALARWSHAADATVMISARAVYVDAQGRHTNSDEAPRWEGPTPEDTPTLAFAGEPYRSREGYGANKAEAERLLAATGRDVSVLRPARIHGPGVRRVREWPLLRAGLDGTPVIRVRDGSAAPSVTSGEAIARTILACAADPATRVLNVADVPPTRAIDLARAALDATGGEASVLVDVDDAEEALALPWTGDQVLATDRVTALGVALPPPVETVADAARWVASRARRSPDGTWELPPHLDGS